MVYDIAMLCAYCRLYVCMIGTIPPALGNLTKLTTLQFQQNRLTGSYFHDRFEFYYYQCYVLY